MTQPMLARCRAVAQNANAAALLYRIAYWMPRARIERGGHKWIANSASEWCEQTGLSVHQYRRAIAQLRHVDLIKTEQHLFGGRNVTHLRLTEKGEASLARPEPRQIAMPDLSAAAPPNLHETAQLQEQGASTGRSLQERTTLPLAPARANGMIDRGDEAGEEGHRIARSRATSSLNAQASRPPVHLPDDRPAALASLWGEIVAREYGDYVPPSGKKQLGQFKAFVDACPVGQARLILAQCLTDWTSFCIKAKTDYGAFGIPAKPTLDFLLKYVAAAANMTIVEAAPSTRTTDANDNDVQSSTRKLELKPSYSGTHSFRKHRKATREEALAILSEP